MERAKALVAMVRTAAAVVKTRMVVAGGGVTVGGCRQDIDQ